MTPKAKPEVEFWWFEPATVEALKERLAAAGSGTRLEVRLDNEKLFLRVVPAGVTTEGAAGDDLDKSHPCPPDCP